MTASTNNLRRTVCKPLTVAAINAMTAGQTLADGGINTGVGRLKVRKRQTQLGAVTEWQFIYWSPHSRKRVTMLLNGKASRYSPKEQDGHLTIAMARVLARGLQLDVQQGVDPAMQRELKRAATTSAQAVAVVKQREAKEKTLQALMDAYVASLVFKGKAESAYDVKNLVKNHISDPFPELAATPAALITPQTVSQVLARLVGPNAQVKKGRTALKLRSYMAAAYKLALGAGVDPMAPVGAAGFELTMNPAAAVPATTMAATFIKVGQRALSPDELRHYLRRLAAVTVPIHRLALELQILSGGQRLQQLLRLTRTDLTDHTFTLFDPKGKRAQPRPHVLPILPELAIKLNALKTLNPMSGKNPGGQLFASSGGSVVNPETLSGVVRQISLAMVEAGEAATPFRGGDIRRTCETMMAGILKISKDIRAQLLSHGISGVQDVVYDKSDHMQAKTAALKSWNNYLENIRKGVNKISNVVSIKAA